MQMLVTFPGDGSDRWSGPIMEHRQCRWLKAGGGQRMGLFLETIACNYASSGKTWSRYTGQHHGDLHKGDLLSYIEMLIGAAPSH